MQGLRNVLELRGNIFFLFKYAKALQKLSLQHHS